jgi:hypothetical protein
MRSRGRSEVARAKRSQSAVVGGEGWSSGAEIGEEGCGEFPEVPAEECEGEDGAAVSVVRLRSCGHQLRCGNF